MPSELDYAALVADTQHEFPSFRIADKGSSRLMKAIDTFLKVVTLGRMRAFITSFITTIGTTVYVPASWGSMPISSKMAVLRHERVHMRQARKHGRLLFSLMYLFFPLPVVFALYRRKFEQEAYEESLRAMQDYHGDWVLHDQDIRARTVAHFTSAEYFWMWPWKKQIERWYDETVAKLLARPQ